MTASNPPKSVAVIVREIHDAIGNGRVVPGQRLYESDLIEFYGASHRIAHDSILFLAGEGVVELSPKRGARIRKFDALRRVHLMEVFSNLLHGGLDRLLIQPIQRTVRSNIKEALAQIIDAQHGGMSGV